jgi:hypothetical protein
MRIKLQLTGNDNCGRKALEMMRSVLASLVIIGLAGCRGGSPVGRSPDLVPGVVGLASDFSSASWISANAKSRDLLYVTNSKTVTIYSYPQGKLEGSIAFGYSPSGECTDRKGDVFVTNLDTSQIVEYRHGEKKPAAVLQSPSADAAGCAIDPTNGNLAVSSLGFGANGSVAVFKRARGKPVTYQDPTFQEYFLCGYDPKGNLFVDGLDKPGSFKFAELPQGKSKFIDITLNPGIVFPGAVQWVDNYVAVGDQGSSIINHYAISGNSGSKAGSTSLGSDVGPVFQFLIAQKRIIVPNQCKGSCTGNVMYFNWPAGGDATKVVSRGVRYPHGVALSKA